MHESQFNLLNEIIKHEHPLKDVSSLDPLIEKIGDSRIVLLGEASHGTHEYYTWRAKISQRLIQEKGFQFIAVEGDWPDCYRLNRYIKNYPDSGENAEKVLHEFNRWPTWMWANWEIVAFAERLRKFNHDLPLKQKIGFYGLDVYSLWESLAEILHYLEHKDPSALHAAQLAISCFEPYRYEGQSYALATQLVPNSCQEEVLQLLQQIRRKTHSYDGDQELVFSTEQNALVAVNAERYYRSMLKGGASSWNIRDQHMFSTLTRLMNFHGPKSKVIVWEHNTHIGDARATDMARQGMFNIGQLVRENFSKEECFLIGFGSYQGNVIAGNEWGAKMEAMPLPPARKDSWEFLLHQDHGKNKLLLMEDLKSSPLSSKSVDHRAVGVVYHPQQERYGNYVPSLITQRYDAFIYFDQTHALHPLHFEPDGYQMPETFPWGV
ncbi:MAG: erythromycin esterase family protein [Deltaproteobacteria bacterium]|nr:erythromycin esterase family protein [Deltaproteobacteria bacterium]